MPSYPSSRKVIHWEESMSPNSLNKQPQHPLVLTILYISVMVSYRAPSHTSKFISIHTPCYILIGICDTLQLVVPIPSLGNRIILGLVSIRLFNHFMQQEIVGTYWVNHNHGQFIIDIIDQPNHILITLCFIVNHYNEEF